MFGHKTNELTRSADNRVILSTVQVVQDDKIQEVGMGGACLTSWKQNLVGRSEGNRLLGRPLRRRGDDIKVDIEERSWGVVGCVAFV
jgi:hypothetical protein